MAIFTTHGLEASTRPPSATGFLNSPVVMDTGDYSVLTPYQRDFITNLEVNIPLRNVSEVNRVIGVGIIIFRFHDQRGHAKLIHYKAYHLPEADILL